MALCDDVRGYWNSRAEGYSLRNCDELDGPEGEALAALFREVLDPKPGMTALDAGCGPGIMGLTLAKLGCRVTGVDLSPEMIDRARENAEARGLDAKYMLGDASDPALEPGSLDLIVSRWVVWNLPAPADAYRRWMLLLKPGGRFLVIDGNHYLPLFDERYAALHEVTAPPPGHAEKYVRGVDFTVMDRIAHSLPLSRIDRPAWDVEVLGSLGADVRIVRKKTGEVAVKGAAERLVTEFCLVAEKKRGLD